MEYKDLIEERRRIRAEIDRRRAEAVQQIKDLMVANELTLQDLAEHPLYRSQRPPRYADSAGNVWTGLGRRPAWVQRLVEAGIDLELYRVRP